MKRKIDWENDIVLCDKSCQGDICIGKDCPLFEKCWGDKI